MAGAGEEEEEVELKEEEIEQINEWEIVKFNFNGKYASPCYIDNEHVIIAADGINKYFRIQKK